MTRGFGVIPDPNQKGNWLKAVLGFPPFKLGSCQVIASDLFLYRTPGDIAQLGIASISEHMIAQHLLDPNAIHRFEPCCGAKDPHGTIIIRKKNGDSFEIPIKPYSHYPSIMVRVVKEMPPVPSHIWVSQAFKLGASLINLTDALRKEFKEWRWKVEAPEARDETNCQLPICVLNHGYVIEYPIRLIGDEGPVIHRIIGSR